MHLPDRILFVGAHCDDIELMAGGLLGIACRSKKNVGVLVFSDHRGVVDEEAAARAREELHQNIEWLSGETGAEIADHSERWLPACQGSFEAERARIFAAMESLRDRYDMVVTHAAGDTNQDHRQVAIEARRVFKAHTTVLGGEFPANDVGTFRPQVFVALDDGDLDAKVTLIGRYASQRRSHRPYLEERVIRGLAAVRGSQVQAGAAEAFEVLTRVVVRG